MKKARVFIRGILTSIFIASMCTASCATEAPTSVSIASGTSGGAFYMVGAALAQVIQKYTPISANSEATGGTSENIRLISTEETDIGMAMADDLVYATKGERGYRKPHENLRVIMSGQTNTFHIITKADSGIKTLKDFKGKNVSVGPKGAPFFGPDLLKEVAGLEMKKDYRGQYLGHDQAADALANGDVDALVAVLAYPAGAYSNLALTNDIRFIQFSDEEMAIINKAFPFWQDVRIPKGVYENEEEIRTAAVPVWLFTNASVDEETIYQVTKAILEHSEELGKIHPDAGKYKLETAIQGVTLPLHPGAERYYKEKGIL